jgi:hypothetical protein
MLLGQLCNNDNFRSPPIISVKPSITIPDPFSDDQAERISIHDDHLDQHVEDILGKRQRLKRTLQGIGAFLKTRKSQALYARTILTPSQHSVFVYFD